MTHAAETVFYVQGSADAGMGHLARSAALIRAFDARDLNNRVVLRVDDQGRLLARDKGLAARETDFLHGTPAPACIVIDAVTVPNADALALSQSPRRILISPVCDRADLATHALLRSAPEGLRHRLASDCVLTEDDRFTYATAAGLARRALDHESRLVVGICLSGGAGQPEIGALLHAARTALGVEAVHVIHPETPDTGGAGPAVHHRAFCNDPWGFLASVNVFVGGDGVMIAEAVAQGLPCLSITRPGAPTKNRGLVDAGCIEVCHRDAAPTALTALLSNRARLAGMHRSALEQGAGRDADALACALAQLAQNGRT
jgi:hypothetical protein